MGDFSTSGQALLDHLAGGCTTVCRCWKVTRKDGQTLGFTDHDGDLDFDGTRFAASTGFTGSALEQSTGLSVDNSEAIGGLSAEAITETDVTAGRYDGAAVTAWLVNWAHPAERLVQFNGSIGEVTRVGETFKAELRGMTEVLNQPQGRVYQSACSAVLGDGSCGIDLCAPGHSQDAVVLAAEDPTIMTVSDDGGQENRWFDRGRLVVLDGAAAGTVSLIKRDRISGASREIEVWQAMRQAVLVGDRIRLEAGCDKRAQTCREKFQNFVNFRGFPHIPGEDWLTAYPRQSDDNDGGSLNG